MRVQAPERFETQEGYNYSRGYTTASSASRHLPPHFSHSQRPTSLQSLSEKLSYAQAPRPFKNPAYTKNNGRRAKNPKAVLAQERERARAAAERMAVDGDEPDPDPLNCECIRLSWRTRALTTGYGTVLQTCR